MPTVDVNKWSTRPQEIVGFQTYLEALIAWLCVCVATRVRNRAEGSVEA